MAVRKVIAALSEVMDKALCIFDDIPPLFQGINPLTGLFSMIGAGYLIFGVQLYKTKNEFMAAWNQDEEDDSRTANVITSLAKLICAIVGIVMTTVLLALAATGLVMLAVATSSVMILAAKTILLVASTLTAIVPLIMGVVAGYELLQAIDNWTYANDEKSAEEAKTEVMYNIAFFGLALAVVALSVTTVVLGAGIPTFILMGVIGVSVALKIFQKRETIWEACCKAGDYIKEKLEECYADMYKMGHYLDKQLDYWCGSVPQVPVSIEIMSTESMRIKLGVTGEVKEPHVIEIEREESADDILETVIVRPMSIDDDYQSSCCLIF